MVAAREGEPSIVEFLIRNGADLNAQTRDGYGGGGHGGGA
ncbi:ankyrin repeat protein [Leptospira broomii serovar Hurstbridge str. 5399]|uniref:Ankyrin repeat protein n=1 Tax=Leptospira broomii serovar Hurstbridge str. 5399 TaxID=1049789 RepID=T0FDN7_9LEPT|nr:ankyrin repeat protein [Leptospira broomii serovar Hurstbridge str. 5399]